MVMLRRADLAKLSGGSGGPPIVYEPEHHQARFHRACDEVENKVTWLCAGVGGGKTTAGVQESYRKTTVKHPGYNGLIVVPDYATYGQVIQPEIEKWWPRSQYRFKTHLGHPIVRVKTRKGISTIFIRSAHNKLHADKILGLDVAWAYLEEAARMPCGEIAFKWAQQRCRAHGPVDMHIVGSPRPGWLPRRFRVTDGLPWEAYRGFSPRRGYHIMRAHTDWNSHLDDSYYETLDAEYEGDEKQQELYGQVVSMGGRVYPNFFKAMHVIDGAVLAAKIRQITKWVGGVDWGWRNPAAVIWGGWTHDGEFIVVGEWYHRKRYIEVYGAHVADVNQHTEMIHGKKVTAWWADSAEPRSISRWQDGFRHSGKRYRVRNVEGADKDVFMQESMVRALLERSTGKDHPRFPQGNRYGAPRLYVAAACKNLIEEFYERRDRDDTRSDDRIPSEDDRVGRNHALNALEYAISNSSRTLGITPSFLQR